MRLIELHARYYNYIYYVNINKISYVEKNCDGDAIVFLKGSDESNALAVKESIEEILNKIEEGNNETC